MVYLRQIVQEEVMITIKLFTIGCAWACWLLALVIWSKLSWIFLIGGIITYLILNQYTKNSNNSEDDEKKLNRV